MNDILQSVLLGITLAAPIGPAGLAVIQTGLRHGFWRALWTGIGVTAADTTYLMVVYFGLAGFINQPAVKIAIWSFGALALIYLGVQSIREAGTRLDFEGQTVPRAHNPFLVGYVVNISNPIAAVFWLGIYGSLLGSALESGSQISALARSATILVGILSWHTFTSGVSNWGARLINRRTGRLISLVAGIALTLFGLRFGYNAFQALLQG